MADPEEVVKMNPKIKTITEANLNDLKCQFCWKNEINGLEWGPMYQLEDVVVHYFCMLFSAALTQNGNDNEGILGFLDSDLKKEMRRGEKLKCKYCKKNRATVGCIISDCKAMFHFSCGVANGTMHHFTDNFASYCPKHKPLPKLPFEVPAEGVLCEVCQDNVLLTENWVWPPCCKLRLYHRSCIQEYAKRAGYSFSCPSCKATGEFIDAMKKSGVYIPDQDAAWERDPNFFRELTEMYSNCDADVCYCPQGRNYDAEKCRPVNRNWKIIRCGACGASAVHYCCGQLKLMKWKCGVCVKVMSGDAAIVINSSDSSDDSSGDSDVEESVLKEYEKVRQNMIYRASMGKEALKGYGNLKRITDNIVRTRASKKIVKHVSQRNDKVGRLVYDPVRKRRYRVDVTDGGVEDDESSVVSNRKGQCMRISPKSTCSADSGADALQKNIDTFTMRLRSLRLSCAALQGRGSSCSSSSSLLLERTSARSVAVEPRSNDSLLSTIKLSNLDLSEYKAKNQSDASFAQFKSPRVLEETKSWSESTNRNSMHSVENKTVNLPSPSVPPKLKKTRLCDEIRKPIEPKLGQLATTICETSPTEPCVAFDERPTRSITTAVASSTKSVITSDVPPTKSGTTSDVPPRKSGTTSDVPPLKPVTTSDVPPTKPVTTSDVPPTKPGTSTDVPPTKPVTTSDVPPTKPGTSTDVPATKSSTITSAELRIKSDTIKSDVPPKKSTVTLLKSPSYASGNSLVPLDSRSAVLLKSEDASKEWQRSLPQLRDKKVSFIDDDDNDDVVVIEVDSKEEVKDQVNSTSSRMERKSHRRNKYDDDLQIVHEKVEKSSKSFKKFKIKSEKKPLRKPSAVPGDCVTISDGDDDVTDDIEVTMLNVKRKGKAGRGRSLVDNDVITLSGDEVSVLALPPSANGNQSDVEKNSGSPNGSSNVEENMGSPPGQSSVEANTAGPSGPLNVEDNMASPNGPSNREDNTGSPLELLSLEENTGGLNDPPKLEKNSSNTKPGCSNANSRRVKGSRDRADSNPRNFKLGKKKL